MCSNVEMNASIDNCRYSLRSAAKSVTSVTTRATRAKSVASSAYSTNSQIRRSARLAAHPRICYAGMDCDEDV